ncbi:hypothetical protein EV198_0639 [Roseivirga ehrenbergii]|uniref:Uncharacterized protein n=1 Tax=Roseivirga ehrenbergii (strain DSM 102268 / JCM 13514 / KCTC 12282 / NCIMB 14502 / KMM 6017) TaxID=279360 RepID=A0A150X7Z7_ROSEK|nr:hypothetical protein [Roseivirga ehrenbergii]KYG74855.1 hypothetical protein MB14_06540 [Roseivirga ehrenbergii]TCL13807.1 hypothetical protein EV198_0639 [Roseivirga ehrenbergii]
MNEEEFNDEVPQEGLPIPEIFKNSDTKGYITHCIQCDYELLKGDRSYMIEKVFKRYPNLDSTQVLFEYGMCSVCYEKMKDSLSAESMQNLSNYMMNNMDFSAMQQRIEENPEDPEKWMSHCMIHGTPKEEMTEYQVAASFKGDRLMTNFMPPYMIGGMALEELNGLLSKETKEDMDGFIDQHFGIPPELRKDFILI